MRYTAILSPLAFFFLKSRMLDFLDCACLKKGDPSQSWQIFHFIVISGTSPSHPNLPKTNQTPRAAFSIQNIQHFQPVSQYFSNKFKLIYNWCGDHYWEILHQKKWSGLKMWLLWYWLAVDRGWWWVDGRRRRRVMERGVVRHTGVGPHRPKTTQKLDHIDKKYTKDRPHWP